MKRGVYRGRRTEISGGNDGHAQVRSWQTKEVGEEDRGPQGTQCSGQSAGVTAPRGVTLGFWAPK